MEMAEARGAGEGEEMPDYLMVEVVGKEPRDEEHATRVLALQEMEKQMGIVRQGLRALRPFHLRPFRSLLRLLLLARVAHRFHHPVSWVHPRAVLPLPSFLVCQPVCVVRAL